MNNKFTLTSDTHGAIKSVRNSLLTDNSHLPCDYFVVAGDICPDYSMDRNDNSPQQAKWLVEKYIPWLRDEVDATHKVVIAGNHDFVFEDCPQDEMRKQFASNGIHYLHHEAKQIGDYKFFGSPWTPWFYNWAFNFPQIDKAQGYSHSRLYWDMIPDDTEILITHGPPRNILDLSASGDHCGCPELSRRIHSLEDLKLHAFGHIHEPRGGDYRLPNGGICANVAYGYYFQENKTTYQLEIVV